MGRHQEYKVKLSTEEREYLEKNSSSGAWTPRQVKRALILLKADRNHKKHLTDKQIAEELKCCHATVNHIRERFANEGLMKALEERPRAGRPKIIDGDVEAHIVATACSSPPEGRERWTLQLIADKVVTLDCDEKLSHMSISRVLKKANLNLG